MKQALKALLVGLVTSTQALTTSGTGSTHEVEKVSTSIQKYSELVSKRDFGTYRSNERKAWEAIFGPSQEEVAFQDKLQSLKSAQRQSWSGKDHRLGAKWTFKQEYADLYIGKFYIAGGDKMFNGVGIIDTATDLSLVKGRGCAKCTFEDDNSYDIFPALRYGEAGMDAINTTVTYGNIEFKGAWAEAQFYFNQESNGLDVPRMQFFYSQKTVVGQLEMPIEGIFGLARMDQKMRLSEAATPDNGKRQFLESIGDFLDKHFSVRFSSDHFSWLDVGTYNSKEIEDESKLDPIEVYDDFFWSMPLYGVKFGDTAPWSFQREPSAIMDENRGVYTIFDTATADIFISDLYYEDFLRRFFEINGIKNYEVEGGIVTSECADFVPIEFLFRDRWLTVNPEHYYLEKGDLCQFRFKGVDAPFNIIGLPVYMDYYVTHDYGSQPATISFVPNNRNKKSAPREGTLLVEDARVIQVQIATKNTSNAETQSLIIAGIIAGLILAGAVAFAINLYRNDSINMFVVVLISLGALAVSLLLFYLLYLAFLNAFMPGDTPVEVVDAGEAVTKVTASKTSLFALLTFAIYKLFSKGREQATKAE